jgi:hypothetical protein
MSIFCKFIFSDAQKCHSKFEKQSKAEKTGSNVVKTEQAGLMFQMKKSNNFGITFVRASRGIGIAMHGVVMCNCGCLLGRKLSN